MRIALLSDIHGNPVAFDAVLDDIQSQGGVDGYWILGDHANQGYDPVGVVERINGLSDARCVTGNTDRYVVKGGRRGLEHLMKNPDLITQLESVEQGNGWARGALAATGWFEWIRDLPFERRTTLPDGTRMLGVHASLVSDELGFLPETTDKELAERFPNLEAELVVAGHTHEEAELNHNGTRFITLGCVANSLTSDRRAHYSILEATKSGHEIIRRRIAFDYEKVIAGIKASHHPSEQWLLKFYQQM